MKERCRCLALVDTSQKMLSFAKVLSCYWCLLKQVKIVLSFCMRCVYGSCTVRVYTCQQVWAVCCAVCVYVRVGIKAPDLLPRGKIQVTFQLWCCEGEKRGLCIPQKCWQHSGTCWVGTLPCTYLWCISKITIQKKELLPHWIEIKKKTCFFEPPLKWFAGSWAVAGREAGLFKRTVFVFLPIYGSVIDLGVHSARVIVMLLLLQLSWRWRGWNCTHATEWSGIVFSV